MSRSALASALILIGLLFLSCGVERYPLLVDQGQTFLQARDRNGQLVLFLVDTGAPVSLLSRSWVQSVGGKVVPGPPAGTWGVALTDQWKTRGSAIPVPDGVPPLLENLPLVDYGKGGFLGLSPGRPGPQVGTLGVDVLWDWAVDFREEPPVLVRGLPVQPRDAGRLRYDLFQQGGNYVVPAGFVRTTDGELTASRNFSALVDTGCSYPFLAFYATAPSWPATTRNPWTPLRANGLPVTFFTTEGFQIGTSEPDPFVGTVLDGAATVDLFLLGTPFFQSHRALIDLRRWTLEFDPHARTEPVPEEASTWAWRGTLEEGQGLHLQSVEESSTLRARGYGAGDWITTVAGEPVWKPRSVLEWQRLWRALAQNGPDAKP